jgi:hypothetical protein
MLNCEISTQLNKLNLQNKYIMFYHNLEGEEFYSGKLGSDERQARNINIINMFTNISRIKEFATNLYIQDVIKEEEQTKKLSIGQRLNYLVLNDMYDKYIVNIELEKVINDLKHAKNSDEKSLIFKNLIAQSEEFSFLNDFNDPEYINLINDYARVNYPGFINFMMDSSFTYSLQEKNILICFLFISNILFSLYSSIANIDKDIDVYIAEMTEEEFLLYINICTPDFNMSMNENAAKENFPQYKIWKQMEVDFYKSVNNKKIKIMDYLGKTLDSDLKINQVQEDINLDKLF